MNKKTITILIIISLAVTLLSLLYSSESLTDNSIAGKPAGFPFHFVELANTVQFDFIWFLINFAFWLLAVFSIYHLVFTKGIRLINRLISLGIAFSIGFVLLQIYNRTSESCGIGFPLEYRDKCTMWEVAPLDPINLIKDLSFWWVIGCIVVAVFIWSYLPKMSKWKYLTIPILFSLLSFNFDYACSGFICFIDGRGFPLPYFIDSWSWPAFLLNALVWLIIFLIVNGIFVLFKKLIKVQKLI